MANRWSLLVAPLVLATACVCEPTVHVETTYASSVMSDSIQRCANERACTTLCARAFSLDPGEVDHCRILSMDDSGGAEVEVTYTTYTCVADEWSSDDGGGDWGGGDPIDPNDEDPCSYGACDDVPPDDEPPPDDDEPPPDDDEPPPDDDPPMEEP